MNTYTIARRDGSSGPVEVDITQLLDACESLSEGGKYELDVKPNAGSESPVDTEATQEGLPPLVAEMTELRDSLAEEPKANSTFGSQVTDDAARARIEAQHAALGQAGINIDVTEQLYATGTRMSDVGYSTQHARKAEHDAKKNVRTVAEELTRTVNDERRHDVRVTAGKLGKGIQCNGHVTFDGLKLGEQAIRGLLMRIESPALGYVLGLRDRCATNVRNGFRDSADHDRREMAQVLAHECSMKPDVELKLRARDSLGDVFAIVSPGYVPADAPEVMVDLLEGLPDDCKGSFAYDPISTAWEFRANVWTPTPVDEQAVGEAFEGYVSFQSRDNGTSRFRGGGGVTLLRCLNASTYQAASADVARVHRGQVMRDIDRMIRQAKTAVSTLCNAWNTSRESVVQAPSGMTIEEAIPGFYRALLKDTRSELAQVLPGRTERHVEGLTAAFFGERRDSERLVRSDFAQGWTRYIQGQPTHIRREAEAAVGDWLVSMRPVTHLA